MTPDTRANGPPTIENDATIPINRDKKYDRFLIFFLFKKYVIIMVAQKGIP